MQHAQYADFDVLMHLDQDYRAIRWMQDNVQGSPVIVEANCPEYRWCTRFTIHTGLPGVVGWNWHQRQQRTLTPMLVEERVSEIASFYRTLDDQEVVDFLRRYNVRYIIVGEMERAAYPGEGLEKFSGYRGKLWDMVYHEGNIIDGEGYVTVPEAPGIGLELNEDVVRACRCWCSGAGRA